MCSSDLQAALADLSKLQGGKRVPGLSEMGSAQAIAAAQKRVDATKKLFDERFAAAKESGMYGKASMAPVVGGDIETRRFVEIASRAAQGPDTSAERLDLVKRQKFEDDIAAAVARKISERASAIGYTPLFQALLTRAGATGLGGS